MIKLAQNKLVRFLRWTERYTKTDMLYLAKAGWWINLNMVISSAIALLLSVIFANFLSPSTYGLYQYFLSISTLISALALSGMNISVTQAAARGQEGVFKQSIRQQLYWAPIPAFISILGAGYYFLHGNIEVSLAFVCIAVFNPLINVFNTYTAFLHGKKEFRQGFYFSLIINTTYAVFIVLAVFFLKEALLLILVNLAVNTLTTFFAYRKTLKIYKPNDQIDPAAMSYGRHMSVLLTWGAVLGQLDSILVFHFLGAVDLAVYSFATLLPERLGSFFNFIAEAALPKFANNKLAQIQKNILSKLWRVVVLGGVFVVIYVFAAPFLFQLLFPKYVSAVHYTQIYSLVIVFMAISNILNSVLFSQRLKREIYIMGFTQPLLLIVLQLPFLLFYGIMGMLIARLATDFISIILGIILTLRPISKTEETA